MNTPAFVEAYAAAEQRRYEAQCDWSEAVDKAEADLAWDYAMACKQGDVKAEADFAPAKTDYTAAAINGKFPVRQPTLGEVMWDSIDFPGGPSADELFALLLRVANEGDKEARDLVDRMGKKWANLNVGEVM